MSGTFTYDDVNPPNPLPKGIRLRGALFFCPFGFPFPAPAPVIGWDERVRMTFSCH